MPSYKERLYRAIKLAHAFCDDCERSFDKDGCELCWVYWMMNDIIKD